MIITKISSGWFIAFILLTLNGSIFGQSKNQVRLDKLQNRYINEFKINRENGKYSNPDVIFVGSSSFTRYLDFEKDFEGLKAINLGFGGSRLSDVLYFFEELIEPYHPKQIIVYEGDNDLNSGMTVEEFMDDVRTFVRLVQIRKPGTHISFLTPKPSPRRRHLRSKFEDAYLALYDYAASKEGFDFIDISQSMYTLDGQIRTEIWVSDSLHMNRAGYEIWSPIIRSFIRE